MSEEKNTLAIEDNRLEEASFVNYEAMSLSELTKELKELLLTEQFFYFIFFQIRNKLRLYQDVVQAYGHSYP